MMQKLIAKLIERQHLSRDESVEAMNQIMDGQATAAQMAAFLIALRMKGETVDEIAGCAAVMREKAVSIKPQRTDLVDTAGTGGDHAGTFNISTTAAFVIAGAGLGVAKHGNRAVSSKSGSADVLEALNVFIDLTPAQVARCIDEVGIGFLFAPRLHPAMKSVMPVRRELGIRTLFNILGPLTNPARTPAQIVGVYSAPLTSILANVLRALGSQEAMVFHSADGLDELTTTAVNHLARFHGQEVREEQLNARDLGFREASLAELRGGSPADNALLVRGILSGAVRDAKRDVVVLNTAAALMVGKKANDLHEGIALAQESIDSGRALRALDELIKISHGFQKSNLS